MGTTGGPGDLRQVTALCGFQFCLLINERLELEAMR